MFKDELALIEENSFAVSAANGDMVPGVAHGLFFADTRFLSVFALRLWGKEPVLLSSGNLRHDAAAIYATNPQLPNLPLGTISLVRDRYVCGGMHEDISLANHLDRAVVVDLTFDFGADFGDIFEVRGGEVRKVGTVSAEATERGELAFTYRRAEFVRRTLISFSERPTLGGQRATFSVALGPKERWRMCLMVQPVIDDKVVPVPCRAEEFGPAFAAGVADKLVARAMPRPTANGRRWLAEAPRLRTHDAVLGEAYRRAVLDLAALAMKVDTGHVVPAAGLPWYMAMFGRDSLITSYQTLMLGPELATGVLRTMAAYQSHRRDDFRDEQPGKIPHEVRSGELACLDDVPHSRYYGTVDATPLFLILLSETFRWTGDLALVREMLSNVERALEWIDKHGDMDGDGFVEYKRRSPHGLRNQGWKDSEDSVCFADGRLAETPIALAEVQGYVFDAKRRVAELFRALGQHERAASLEQEAAALSLRFEEAFWMEDEGFYAMALDGSKRQVTSITSNPGHCLWSGIVSPDRAAKVAERLLAPDMFSGWGIRTMSSRMRAYNPLSYHNGSVWPHDNSLIVAGLLRYGFTAEAKRVSDGILEASAHFPLHRLPELFAGYPRRPGGFPVEYPGAGAPQAWAAGSVVLLLQCLLGLQPGGPGLDPRPLDGVPSLRLEGVPYRGRRSDIAVGEEGRPSPEELLAARTADSPGAK